MPVGARHWGQEGSSGGRRRTYLRVPTITEEEKLKTVKEHVESKAARSEDLALEPVFAHGVALGLCAVPMDRIPNEGRPAGQTKE